MREKKAKKIRRAVYGDLSRRGTKYVMVGGGVLEATGRRRIYQAAKRVLKENPGFSIDTVVDGLVAGVAKNRIINGGV